MSETKWKSLPPLSGGIYVGMVTEVLDRENIPNVVKTDLAAGGLGMIQGTSPVGKPWRIQVPEEYFERAIEIFESLLHDRPDEDSAEPES